METRHVSFANGSSIRRMTPSYLHISNVHYVILGLSHAAMPCLRYRSVTSCASCPVRPRRARHGTNNRVDLVSALPHARLTSQQRPAKGSTAQHAILLDGLCSGPRGGAPGVGTVFVNRFGFFIVPPRKEHKEQKGPRVTILDLQGPAPTRPAPRSPD